MLNLLASAIPGLRDLRAPLVAGYLWLLVAWLAIKPSTPLAAHATGVAKSLVGLAQTVGPAATAAGVTVTAYVIGAISVSLPSLVKDVIESALAAPSWELESMRVRQVRQETESLARAATRTADNAADLAEQPHTEAALDPEYADWPPPRRHMGRVGRWGSRLLLRLLTAVARLIPSGFGGLLEIGRLEITLTREKEWRELVDELAQAESTPEGLPSAGMSIPLPQLRPKLWRTASTALHAGPSPELQDVRDTLEEHWDELSAREIHQILARTDELRQQLRREVNLPNTLLVGDQPEIYAEADRARAEAEFRLALVLPTIALVIVLVVVGTPWWVFGLFAPAALFFTGLAKRDEARTFVLNSIESGKTPSPATRRFSEYVTRRLALKTPTPPDASEQPTPAPVLSSSSAQQPTPNQNAADDGENDEPREAERQDEPAENTSTSEHPPDGP